MPNVGELLEKINLRCPVRTAEPLNRHTTFRIGGPADALVAPRETEDVRRVAAFCRDAGVPLFVLGGGANLLVADRGIRGVVLDTSALTGTDTLPGRPGTLRAWAGTPMDDLCRRALEAGLEGLAAFAAMPGSVGGSIWMNARCCEVSLSDRLEAVEELGDDLAVREEAARPGEFGYKRSPFQARRSVILRGTFRLQPGDPRRIRAEMEDRRRDREAKGHFLHPSAGSVFKNNRTFGRPTGAIIDALGLKGRRIGDAEVSSLHANIIVNRGCARAADVLALIRLIEGRVRARFGFALEREVLLVGDWGDDRGEPA